MLVSWKSIKWLSDVAITTETGSCLFFFNSYLIARHYLKETEMHSRSIKFFRKHIYDAPVIRLCIKPGAEI